MVRLSRILMFSLALFAVVFVAIPSAARADKIKLKDKRVFEGKILSESEEVVEIDTLVTGIRVTMKFKPKDIFEITKEDLPADFFGKPKDKPEASNTKPTTGGSTSNTGTPAPKPDAPAAKPLLIDVPPIPPAPALPDPKDVGEHSYLEIPLKGVFGVDIAPEGVKEALTFASKQPKIKHIVFTIDSPGGRVDAADEILKTMREYSERFEYHIIIKSAISASIWVVFSCDTIHMLDGSSVGGAVVYSHDDFGNFEVEAKMTSILCASVRSEAERKKHPADLVDAMMIQAATCGAWKDAEGKVHVAKSVPKGTPPESIIFQDDKERVLTLTQKQAVDINLAVPHKGGPDGLDKSLGLTTGWKKFSTHGEWAMEAKAIPMKAKQKAAEAYLARIQELGPYIRQNFMEADENDPDAHINEFARYQTGKFTEDSKRRWIQRTDAAIQALDRVRKGLEEIEGLQGQLVANGIPRPVPELWMKSALDRCDRETKRLKQNRTRNGI